LALGHSPDPEEENDEPRRGADGNDFSDAWHAALGRIKITNSRASAALSSSAIPPHHFTGFGVGQDTAFSAHTSYGRGRLLPARGHFDYGWRPILLTVFLSLALPAFVTTVAGGLLE
jgi:hypothetical protein